MNQVRLDESRSPEGSCRSRENIERMADRVARSRISVLILGETGVGKEVLAQRIHRHSPRALGPIVSMDCASLCPTLIESQLFGYERGAFTGAVQANPGLFEAADGGTLFLDEIGELPASAQVKLLRVLETRTIQRVGSTKTRTIDVRFLAATNRDLAREVQLGGFRSDLLFRLDGIRIIIPPLRVRTSEIPELAASFLAETSAREGVPCPGLSPEALDALLQHPWPGNIRELRNVVERAVLLCAGNIIEPEDLTLTAPVADGAGRALDPVQDLDQRDGQREGATSDARRGRRIVSRETVVLALARFAGNQTRAGAWLGISRRTLLDRIELYDLPRPRKSRRPRSSVEAPDASFAAPVNDIPVNQGNVLLI